MLGALARGDRLRRQLDAQAGAARRAHPLDPRQGDRRARADARLRDLGERAGDPRATSRRSVHILTGAGPGRRGAARTRTSTRSPHASPATGSLFERKVAPDDVAAYVHSGGTTGSPKLVKLTHRGFAYKCWANAVVMAHTADDVIFADYPMFHIAGIFGRGYVRDRARHGDRHPLAARRARQALHRQLLEVRREVPRSPSSPACRRRSHSWPRAARTATGSARCATMPAPARPPFPAEVARQIETMIGVRVLLTYGATEYTQNVTPGAARRRPEIRLARHPRCPTRRSRRSSSTATADRARLRGRRDRRRGRQGSERHARLSRPETTTRACSRATAGSTPATSAASTPTAISGSPAAPRT